MQLAEAAQATQRSISYHENVGVSTNSPDARIPMAVVLDSLVKRSKVSRVMAEL